MKKWLGRLRAFVLVLGAGFVSAQGITDAVANEEAHEGGHGGKFAAAVFLGATEVEDEWENTLGLEFTYHITHRWSTFALIERSERKEDTTLVLAGLGLHPYKGLVLIAGIGRKDPSGEHENAARLGIAYEIGLGGDWGIEPYAGVDFIEHHDENELVMGVSIGRKF